MNQSIRNLMQSNVISVDSNQSVKDAAELMSKHNIGVLPVTESGQVVGMVTDRDITLRNTAQGQQGDEPVSQIMSNNVIQATPEMDVQEAAQIMSQNQIRRLPVVENGRIIGMLSLGDLATNEQFDHQAEETLTNISTPSKPQL
ncbi:CBS domain-containing protein [Bacillus tianshenii]|nr:CBS domain-containing protein [Bacillus tianshenii]